MKKLVAWGLTTVMVATSLVGCGKSSSKYLLDIDYKDYAKLCEYKGVKATKIIYEVTDEAIMEEIEYGLYDYATYDPITDRGAEIGDYATIAYDMMIDGAKNEDLSSEEEEVLIGEGYLYPELEEALVGMKTGESKEVEVELTADYVEETLVGKNAMVKVTMNEITVENVPEYNLDFVKENTEFDTMEAYEASIEESLLAAKEEEYKYVAIEEIFAHVIENSEFDGYPEELYKQCEEAYDQGNEYYASMYGMELDEFLELFGIDEETKKEEILSNVNYELVIGAIAQAEGIDCTEKEVNEYVDEIYGDYGYESAEAFLKDYTLEEIGYDLIYQKVCDFLYENATFVEKAEADYLAEQEAMYSEDVEEDAAKGEELSDDSGEENVIDMDPLQDAEEEQTDDSSDTDTTEENGSEVTEASPAE